MSAQLRAARMIIKLGLLTLSRDMPVGTLVVTHIIPEIMRMWAYALLAYSVGGDTAFRYALAGIVVLSTTRMTISLVSGLPVDDVWLKTLAHNSTGIVPLFGQYVLRAIPLGVIAMIDSLCILVLSAPWLPEASISHLLRVWGASLVCIPSGIAFGLAISVTSIGNNMQNLVHNVAVSLVTICSGAVIPLTNVPAAERLGQWLPLSHAVELMRSGLAQEPLRTHWTGEILVFAVWLMIAAVAFHWSLYRAKKKGLSYLDT